MTSLSRRLDDLDAAFRQGLISEDDYRLLRRDAFEKHSTEPNPQPSQAPTQPPPPPAQTLRRKGSVYSGVANLFRRATGRPSKKHLPAVQETAQAPASSPDSLAPPHRRTTRKPSLLSLKRSDPPETDENPGALRVLIASTEEEHSRLLDAFASLESSTLKRIQYKTARRLYTPTPTSVNVLIEGREWRKHTKPVPSIILPPPSQPINHRGPHHHSHHPLKLSTSSSTGTHASDQLSIHSAASGSSSKVSLSRSFTSLPRSIQRSASQPRSPLSPHFHPPPLPHPLQRQDSVSSASTHSTGASSRLLGPRSVGNLYHLTSLAERSSSSTGADTVAESRTTEDSALDDDDPEAADYESAISELNDIRRRREELNARFMGRLEYLKAKLRAAELHERVMRR